VFQAFPISTNEGSFKVSRDLSELYLYQIDPFVAFSNWPGEFLLFPVLSPIGSLISWYIGQEGRIKFLTEARASKPFFNFNSTEPQPPTVTGYEKTGWNIITLGFLFPASIFLLVSDADIIKQLTHNHPAFPKPTWLYTGLARFGRVSSTSSI
jgi:hypothetical protein